MSDTVDVEVLIVSFNSADVLRECLASIERVAPGTPIAIREHGQDPVSRRCLAALAAAHTSTVRIEDDPTNPGFGAGCNALARSSTATTLLFLNPDAEVENWPWSTADPPPSKSIVGARIIGSGAPARHWGTRYRVRDEIARSWRRQLGTKPNGRGFVSGAALLVDRQSFGSVGGFDEQYFLFYEDIDMCLRANSRGIPTVVDERWTVRHSGAHSTRRRFAHSLVWSYESGVRFHSGQGEFLPTYRVYVVVDSLARAFAHLMRSDRAAATAYLSLARRAVHDLLRSQSRPPVKEPV